MYFLLGCVYSSSTFALVLSLPLTQLWSLYVSHMQPENLLLASKTPGASVKLADFGLAVEAMDGKHYYGQPLTFTSTKCVTMYMHVL